MIQPSLFSSRQTRRMWLERLIMPALVRESDGRSIRTSSIKHLLTRLESFCGNKTTCHPSITTLARQMNVSARTVMRNISDAVELGFLTVRPRSGEVSLYEINWPNVAQAILDNPLTTALIDPYAVSRPQQVGTSDTPDNLARTPDNLARTPDNLSPTPDNLSPTPDNLTGTPDNLSSSESALTYSSRGRAEPMSNHKEPMSKPPCRHSDSVKRLGGRSQARNEKSGLYGGWPFSIDKHDFGDARKINALWAFAQTRNYVRVHERKQFFTLAAWVYRRALAGVLHNPPGCFTRLVKAKKWRGSAADQNRAVAMLIELDPIRQVKKLESIGNVQPSEVEDEEELEEEEPLRETSAEERLAATIEKHRAILSNLPKLTWGNK